MTNTTQFDPVSLEIMWSRMLNVAEEMWSTILRTAVSTIIASANDFGCEVLDAEGRSLAHAYRSMPVFNMTMPNVAKEILKKYPIETMHPGDVYMTNDPWMCAGHLPDIAVVTPAFYQGKVVAFAGNIANTSDIGGSLDAKNVRDSYEEGIFFPICKLYHQGEVYGAILVAKDQSSDNADTLRVLMRKENNNWVILSKPPAPILSAPSYPDINRAVLVDINQAR